MSNINRKAKMNASRFVIAALVVLFVASGALFAQGQDVKKAEIPLTDPGKPGLVKVELMLGSISVTGYNGKTVLVEAASWKDEKKAEKKDEPEDEKAKGMKRITPANLGLTIEEENNVVEIGVDSWTLGVNLDIRVPFASSLELKSMRGGEIKVDKISGELDVTNMQGPITMTNVSGTVVAHTMNGGVTVTFENVAADKPMSFSSMNGNLDVTLPANLKADVKLKTSQGNIYSDFDIVMKQDPGKVVEDERKKGGKFKVTFGDAMYGTINGGGKEISFKTFQGNIYIRKKK